MFAKLVFQIILIVVQQAGLDGGGLLHAQARQSGLESVAVTAGPKSSDALCFTTEGIKSNLEADGFHQINISSGSTETVWYAHARKGSYEYYLTLDGCSGAIIAFRKGLIESAH